MPGSLTQANQSSGNFQTSLVDWLDTRLEGERNRPNGSEELKLPTQLSVDEEGLRRRETDFLIKVADLQGTEIPDLDALSKSRVDRRIREAKRCK